MRRRRPRCGSPGRPPAHVAAPRSPAPRRFVWRHRLAGLSRAARGGHAVQSVVRVRAEAAGEPVPRPPAPTRGASAAALRWTRRARGPTPGLADTRWRPGHPPSRPLHPGGFAPRLHPPFCPSRKTRIGGAGATRGNSSSRAAWQVRRARILVAPWHTARTRVCALNPSLANVSPEGWGAWSSGPERGLFPGKRLGIQRYSWQQPRNRPAGV